MSKLSESCTRDEVLDAISDGAILHFDEIPKIHQTADIAIHWLTATPSELIDHIDMLYAEVPLSCRTDEFMRTAAGLGCFVLRDTKPHQTGIYRELACLSIGHRRYSVKDLDPAFHDEEMLNFVFGLYPRYMHQWSQKVSGLIDIMSDDLFERCCRAHFLFALDAPEYRVKGDLGRFIDIKELNASEVELMRSKRLLGLITNNLKDDPWPFLESDCVTNPASISEALTCLEDSDPGSSYESIYMACLMREPMCSE